MFTDFSLHSADYQKSLLKKSQLRILRNLKCLEDNNAIKVLK